jgi:hypothetical protein
MIRGGKRSSKNCQILLINAKTLQVRSQQWKRILVSVCLMILQIICLLKRFVEWSVIREDWLMKLKKFKAFWYKSRYSLNKYASLEKIHISQEKP